MFAFRALTGETEENAKDATGTLPRPLFRRSILPAIKYFDSLFSYPDGEDEDNVPIRTLRTLLPGQAGIKSAKMAAVKRTTEVSTESAAAKPKKAKTGQAAAEPLASTKLPATAESGHVSPESPTKLAAEPAVPAANDHSLATKVADSAAAKLPAAKRSERLRGKTCS